MLASTHSTCPLSLGELGGKTCWTTPSSWPGPRNGSKTRCRRRSGCASGRDPRRPWRAGSRCFPSFGDAQVRPDLPRDHVDGVNDVDHHIVEEGHLHRVRPDHVAGFLSRLRLLPLGALRFGFCLFFLRFFAASSSLTPLRFAAMIGLILSRLRRSPMMRPMVASLASQPLLRR